MPTIPTGALERKLRAMYLRFISGLQEDDPQLQQKIDAFQQQSQDLIEQMGGQVAFMGSLADFPAPKVLDLSPVAGKVYDEMKQAAIAAGISIGNGPKETARAMFRAGMDKSYRRLERLARTETTNAYWKNAFDSVADLPMFVMLWGSEDGPRTCAWCRERDGMVIDSSGLRDHPNGRCTPIPTLRSMVEYRGSVRSDGTIYRDPEWSKQRTAPIENTARMETLDPDTVSSGVKAAERYRTSATEAMFDRKGNYNAARGWSSASNRAWSSYTQMGHEDMNLLARNPKAFAAENDEYWTELAQQQSGLLDDLIAKNQLPEDVVVARGITEYPGFAPNTLKAGDIYADPAYLSTSTNLAEAADFASGRGAGAEGWTFMIRAPKGTPALPGADYQQELIFQRGQKQRVLGIDRVNKIIYTEMVP